MTDVSPTDISSPGFSSSDIQSDIDSAATLTTFAGMAPLVCVIVLGFLAIGAPLPVLSLYVQHELGFSNFTVGWVIGLQSLVTVVTRHSAGMLSDRRGARAAALSGLPLAALAGTLYVLSAAVPLSHPSRLALLVAGRITLGLGESLFITGMMAWGIARLGPARTGRVMSWQGIAIYAALGLGAPLGLAVHRGFGFAGVGALTIATPLLALAIAFVLPAVSASGGDRAPFHRVIGLIWRPGAVMALATVPFAGMAAFLPLDYAHFGWSGAGLAMTMFGVGYVLVRLIGGHLSDRYGATLVVSVSLVVEAIGQLMLWLASNPLVALAGAAMTGLGFSLIFPAMGVIATRRVPSAQRGRAVGNFIAFFDIAIGLTGPLVGLVAGGFGYPATFLVGAVAVVIGLAMLPSVRRTSEAG
jgi:MFS family permease